MRGVDDQPSVEVGVESLRPLQGDGRAGGHGGYVGGVFDQRVGPAVAGHVGAGYVGDRAVITGETHVFVAFWVGIVSWRVREHVQTPGNKRSCITPLMPISWKMVWAEASEARRPQRSVVDFMVSWLRKLVMMVMLGRWGTEKGVYITPPFPGSFACRYLDTNYPFILSPVAPRSD
jgi:hypothetical protein